MRSRRVLMLSAIVVRRVRWPASRAAALRMLSPLELGGSRAPPSGARLPRRSSRCASSARRTPSPRTLSAPRDLLVIDGGTGGACSSASSTSSAARTASGAPSSSPAQTVHTAGWITRRRRQRVDRDRRVERPATASRAGDYLEPFVAPVVPRGADRDDAPASPTSRRWASVMFGDDERNASAAPATSC